MASLGRVTSWLTSHLDWLNSQIEAQQTQADSAAEKLSSIPEKIASLHKAVREAPEQVGLTMRRMLIDVPEELRALSDALPPPGTTLKENHFRHIVKVIEQQEIPNDKSELRDRFDALSEADAGKLETFL